MNKMTLEGRVVDVWELSGFYVLQNNTEKYRIKLQKKSGVLPIGQRVKIEGHQQSDESGDYVLADEVAWLSSFAVPGEQIAAYPTASVYVDMQPGDLTWYRFTIVQHPRNPDQVLIASAEGPSFTGYTYNKSSIEAWATEFGPLPPKDEYETWFQKAAEEGRHYVGYVMSHSKCDNWTAVAAIMSAAQALKELPNA